MPKAASDPLSFLADCTVFTFNSDTSIMDRIASGSVSRSLETVEHKALKDTWKHPEATVASASLSFKVNRVLTPTTDWYALFIARATVSLSYTVAGVNRVQKFLITKCDEDMSDEMTWDITAESFDAPTV